MEGERVRGGHHQDQGGGGATFGGQNIRWAPTPIVGESMLAFWGEWEAIFQGRGAPSTYQRRPVVDQGGTSNPTWTLDPPTKAAGHSTESNT